MARSESNPQLQQLLQHPALWRGRSVAPQATVATGHAALDAVLPGGGWPRLGLIEILTAQQGLGELRLWLPALAHLSTPPEARWCAFVGPPFELFAPALALSGVQLERLLIIRDGQSLWAMEQALRSGACDIAFTWLSRVSAPALRRLALATEQGRAPGVVFRPSLAEHESSPAALRLVLDPLPGGVRLRILKSRGSHRDSVDVHWPS